MDYICFSIYHIFCYNRHRKKRKRVEIKVVRKGEVRVKHYLDTERTHLMNPSMNIIIKADIKGEFHEEQFRRAVIELTNTYPILRATVQMDEKGRAFFLPASAEEIQVEIKREVEPIEPFILTENKKIFHLERESMLRIYVMPIANAFSIIFISHHVLGDGKSILLLLEALCKAYVGIDIPYVGIHLLGNHKNFPENSEPSKIIQSYLAYLNKEWRKDGRQFSFQDYEELFQKYHQDVESKVCIRMLNSVETRHVHHRCKSLGVSMNSAVVTAFLMAEKELDTRHKDRVDKIGIAVDIRNDLDFDASHLIGNYASACSFKCGNIERETFDSLVKKVHKKIKRKIDNPRARWICLQAYDYLEETLLDAVHFSQYTEHMNKVVEKCAKMFGYGAVPMDLGVTNLGKVEMEELPSIELESLVLIPPPAPCNDITVGVITYRGVMHWGIQYNSFYVREEMMKKIANRAKQILIEESSNEIYTLI